MYTRIIFRHPTNTVSETSYKEQACVLNIGDSIKIVSITTIILIMSYTCTDTISNLTAKDAASLNALAKEWTLSGESKSYTVVVEFSAPSQVLYLFAAATAANWARVEKIKRRRIALDQTSK